jgi:pilus assembly protein CpaB
MNQEGKNLAVALIAGIFAALLMYSYSQEKKTEYDKEFGSKKIVVVAKKDIQELQTIEDELIELKEVPEVFAQPGVVTNTEAIIGQVASAPIKKGEQILFNKLLQPGAETGISLQVSPSKRAITIPVDETRGVAKLIRPGDRVDLIVALDSGKGMQARRDVITMLTDVPVLATGLNIVNNIPRVFEYDAASKSVTQIALTGDTKYNSITIEVSPKEAQDLVYILSTSPGNIFLSLRNPNDKSNIPRLPSSSGDAIAYGFGILTPSGSSAPSNMSQGNTSPVTIPPQFQKGSPGR